MGFLRHHFPRLWHWAAKWGWAGLMIFGVTLVGVGEYVVGLILLILSALSLTSMTHHWSGIRDWPNLTRTIKSVGTVAAVTLVVVSVMWVYAVKGDHPWSHLARKKPSPRQQVSVAQPEPERAQPPLSQVELPKQPPVKPSFQHAIEISLNCYADRLPIKVPAGSNGHIFPLNKMRNERIPWALFHEIINISGDFSKEWPDPPILEEAKRKNDPSINIWRCDVANHGKDNVLDVQIPLQIRYGPGPDSPWHRSALVLNPVDRGKTFIFYIVNECPVEIRILIPDFGKAKVVGEQATRQFEIELENPHSRGSIQMTESKTNWTSESCSE